MTDRIISYIVNGGTDRDRLLAEADYCDACANREETLGDFTMAIELRDDARVLRERAAEWTI